jgi:hypothetical protein
MQHSSWGLVVKALDRLGERRVADGDGRAHPQAWLRE